MNNVNHEGVHFIYTDEVTPDKVVKFKGKLKDEGKVEYKLLLFKEIEKDAKVIGYLTDSFVKEKDIVTDNNYLCLTNPLCYAELSDKKKLLHRKVGYIRVNTNEYVGVTKSILLFILLFLLAGILLFLLPKMYIPNSNDDIEGSPSNQIIISENAIDMDSIKTDEDGNKTLETPSVYITGQSLYSIDSTNKIVYLYNVKENNNFYLTYKVYKVGVDECLYSSEMIGPGKAEPWNAYDCSEIVIGANEIYYKVDIFDLKGVKVGATSVNGLKVVKE